MTTKSSYFELVSLQKQIISNDTETVIQREIFETARDLLLNDNRILVITGMRRVGKSTLLKQLMKITNCFCYLNTEDERLVNFKTEDFNQLNEVLIEIYGDCRYYFFDEIQNIEKFEIIVRRLQDSGKKVVLTGSNSTLLSMELGTRLTGRYTQIELFPFSFKEFLDFNKVEIQKETFYLSPEKVKLKQYFKQWLHAGGMPEFLKYNDLNHLRILFENIIYRDIIARYNIRKHALLKEMVYLLATNLTLPVTYNSLKNSVGLSNAETAKEYVSYMCNSFLFFELKKYSASYSKQVQNAKKIYIIDNAFHNMLSFNPTDNFGRKLENIIHLFYRSRNFELYYFNESKECDFVAFDNAGKKHLTQVCWELNTTNRDREINGLSAAMEFFNCTEGTLITFDDEDEIKTNRGIIRVVPVWKFLLVKD